MSGEFSTLNGLKISPRNLENPFKKHIFGITKKESFEIMLEFSKEILTKVSFDRFLFRKELLKAIKRLRDEELPSFKNWCLDKFGAIYGDIIAGAFRPAI
jgi:hypothetical protein